MSNFYTNTADNRKASVSSTSDESNRIIKDPSSPLSSSSCSLLNTTNFEFIDAEINSGSNGVSKLSYETNCASKTRCEAGGAASPVSKIENNHKHFSETQATEKRDTEMKHGNGAIETNGRSISVANQNDNKCDNESVGASFNTDGGSAKQPCVNDNSDNPYAELEIYLENVKKEINDVLQRFNSNDEIDSSGVRSSLKRNSKCKPKVKIDRDNPKYIETNEWANNVLKELDNIKLYDEQSNAASGTSKTEDDINICNIPKPKKHTCIALHSFQLDGTSPHEIVNKNEQNTLGTADRLTQTVLKINESNLEKRSISTQTSLKKCDNESTSTIWTSDENLIRNEDNIDEDNKSTSSSAFDEPYPTLSSGKSGNSLDSSEIENCNTESGFDTSTPPITEVNRIKNNTPKRHDPFAISRLNNFTWVRTESVTTQTSPVLIHSGPFFKMNSTEDPDLLEVLSLCGALTDQNDFDDSCCDIDSVDNVLSIGDEKDDGFVKDRCNNIVIKNDKCKLRSTQYGTQPRVSAHSDNFTNYFKYSTIRSTDKETQNSSKDEPFHNVSDQPFPSTASLHSGHNIGLQELTTKSNSAPILLKNERKKDYLQSMRCSRSQSDRYLAVEKKLRTIKVDMARRMSATLKEYQFFRSFSAKIENWPLRKAEAIWRKMRERKIAEIEATEACQWLRAAGFPQYAQMYEDLQFPIDLSNVAKDHPFLENDPLQSLYRRLVALNRCATMRLDSSHKHGNVQNDSEEEEYALSENWTFEQKNRRWSRVCETDLNIPANLFDNKEKTSPSINSSTENLDTNNADSIGFSTLPHGASFSSNENEQLPVRFRRTGSERLKDGAKAFLRRVESIKSRRRKKQNRDGVIISGPETLDLDDINMKLVNLKCVDINKTKSTPPSPIPTSPSPYSISTKSPLINNNDLLMVTDYIKYQNQNRLSPNHCLGRKTQMSKSNRTSPLHFFSHHSPNVTLDFNKSGDDTSSYYSDASQESSGGGGGGTKKRPSKTKSFLQKGRVEDIGAMSDSECHQFRSRKFKQLGESSITPQSQQTLKPSKLLRGGSLNFGKESRRYRDAFNSRSFRSRSSTRKNDETKASTVVRWHSFQSGDRPDNIFKKCQTPKAQEIDGIPLAAMSCGQLQVVRKLALVTLTGYMERYCPTHRSGWNWELPKFIKKIKAPDYKDKKVFGVPFLLLLQRTGETLPKSIQSALKWLKLNALHQIGIFRKSGVKSRIQKLKTVVEESPVVSISLYDIQQAYDVADMVKQYFRELPDTLLTAKMSETFVAIFQHLPPEVRPDAVQSAVLLLPDEHREVLQHLLEFLNNVADNAAYNQMTANNLAVCLAPSLFYNGATSMSSNNFRIPASPRRRKPTGVPDPRELSETRASHECLTYLIENYRTVFTISNEKILRCNFGYMEESRPVPLEVLGEGLQVHDWRGYLYECTSATIKEGREKSRGWISTSSLDPNVEIAFKKVGDGHPLRLWKFTTELDAPPSQVLQYVFKERHQWDQHLLKWRIIEQLDERSEIFQYATGGQTITDYCVLRSWRSDLPRGACVIVETSVDHALASLLLGGVRGVVLASRYLIEPCGNGRSKIMHLSRVDIKGKTPEWYNKTYGHVCAHHLARIRNNFKRPVDET